MEAIFVINCHFSIGEMIKVEKIEEDVVYFFDPYDYVREDGVAHTPKQNVVLIDEMTKQKGLLSLNRHQKLTADNDLTKVIAAHHYLTNQPQSATVRKWKEQVTSLLLGRRNSDTHGKHADNATISTPSSPGSSCSFAALLSARTKRFLEEASSIFSTLSSSWVSVSASPAAAMAQEGSAESFPRDVTFDAFDVHRMLGRGNFGKVMAVTMKSDPTQRHYYAMKRMSKRALLNHPRGIATAVQERNAMIALRHHPFFTRLLCALQTPTEVVLVMEIAMGGDLSFHLKTRAFTLQEIQFYAAELLLALRYLHSDAINLIHRDIKPSNCLLTQDGHIKLSDLGLACSADDTESCCRYAGTAKFAAPEMYRHQHYDGAVDFWSLGHTLFLLFARRMIWQESISVGDRGKKRAKATDVVGKSDLKSLLATVGSDDVITKRFVWPAHITSEFKQLIQALLTPSPAARPAKAQAVMAFAFFRSIRDWDAFERKEAAPLFVPSAPAGMYFDPRLDFEEEFGLDAYPYGRKREVAPAAAAVEQVKLDNFEWSFFNK